MEHEPITYEVPERVGLYIKTTTRNRLNLYKAQLTIELGQSCSQDDAINWLLDKVGVDARQTG